MAKKNKKNKAKNYNGFSALNPETEQQPSPDISSGTASPATLKQLALDFAAYIQSGAVIDPRQFGRPGEARFTSASTGNVAMPYGPSMALAIRYDDIPYEAYDVARFYPILKDCIETVVASVTRAGCHFVSANKKAEALASTLLKKHVRGVNENLTRGAVQFGNQVGEMVEEYCYNVRTSTSQSDQGEVEFVFPIAVGFKKFLYFDPADTILLIDALTGEFGGIKQYVPTLPNRIDIPASKLIHYVNNREYDSVYGFPQTKSAIPFVRLAERLYEDMAKWADLFGAPYKVGHYRPGFTPTGTTDSNGVPQKMDNRAIALGILEGLESGASVAMASEFDPSSNAQMWDVDLLEVKGDGAQHYVEMIKHCNDMIRTSFGIPSYATSESPDKGTYTLGKSMIDLYLRNINSRLDGLKHVWDEQILDRWNTVNFGIDADPIVIEFEPPDMDASIMLLTAMVQNAAAGRQFVDGNGNQITPDWSYIYQSCGVPFTTSSISRLPAKPDPVNSDTTDQQDISGGDESSPSGGQAPGK